ncbi:hypothetical protein SteCoe_8526 [Stentor coeruleus]|uniref:Uncharacterized protein n=1 Tax=Stentor coeruleus TaxID=5963 RepID=A0A1R2CK03_9CILI|nr:hypothetical protein SteCoe_8526 [Stentor coeruleus]
MKKTQERFLVTEKHLKQYDNLLKLKDERLIEQEQALKRDRESLTEDKKKFLISKAKLAEERKKLQEENELLDKKRQLLVQESQNLDKKREEIEKLIQECHNSKQNLENTTEKQDQISNLYQQSLLISRETEIQRLFSEGYSVKTEGDEEFSYKAFRNNDDLDEKFKKIRSKEKKLKEFEKSLNKLKEKFTKEQRISYEMLERKTEALRQQELNLHDQKVKVTEAQMYLSQEIASIERIKELLKFRENSPVNKKILHEPMFFEFTNKGNKYNVELPSLALSEIKERRVEDNIFTNTESLEEINMLKNHLNETENKLKTIESMASCLECDNRVLHVSVLEFENTKTENEELKRHLEEAALSIQGFEDTKSQLDLALSEMEELKACLSIKDSQLASAYSQLDSIKINLDSALSELSVTKTELNCARLTNSNKLKSGVSRSDSTTSDINNLKAQLAQANNEIKVLKEEINDKNCEIEEITSNLQSLQDIEKKLQFELQTLQDEEESLKIENSILRNELNSTKSKFFTVKQDLTKLQNDLLTKSQSFNKTPPTCNISPQSSDNLSKDNTILQKDINEIQILLEEEKDKKNNLINEIQTLKSKLTSTTAELLAIKCHLDHTYTKGNNVSIIETKLLELECCKADLIGTRAELVSSRSEVANLKAELNSSRTRMLTEHSMAAELKTKNLQIIELNGKIEELNKEINDIKGQDKNEWGNNGLEGKRFAHEKAKSLPWVMNDTEKEIKKLQEQVRRLNKMLEDMGEELEEAKTGAQEAEEIILRKNDEIDNLNNKIVLLNDKIGMLNKELAVENDNIIIELNLAIDESIELAICQLIHKEKDKEIQLLRAAIHTLECSLEAFRPASRNSRNPSRDSINIDLGDYSLKAEIESLRSELEYTKNQLELARSDFTLASPIEFLNLDPSHNTCNKKIKYLEEEVQNSHLEIEKSKNNLQTTIFDLETIQNILLSTINELQLSREEILSIRNELMCCQSELLSANSELFRTRNDLELAFLLVDSYKKGSEFEENPKYQEIITSLNKLQGENAALKAKISQLEQYFIIQAGYVGDEIEKLLNINDDKDKENSQIRQILDMINRIRMNFDGVEEKIEVVIRENVIDEVIKKESQWLRMRVGKLEDEVSMMIKKRQCLEEECEILRKVNEELRCAIMQDKMSETSEISDLNSSNGHIKVSFNSQIECLQAELEENLAKLRVKEREIKEVQDKLIKERSDLKNDAEYLKSLTEELEQEKENLIKEKENVFAEKFKIATINKKLEDKNEILTEKEKEILLFKKKLEERERLVSIKEKGNRL